MIISKDIIEQTKRLYKVAVLFKLQAFVNVTIGIIVVAADFAYIFASKAIIDASTGACDDFSFSILALALILLTLLQITLHVAHRWIAAIMGVKATNLTQENEFRRVLESIWQGRERRHSGDIVNRLTKDINDIVRLTTESLPQIVVVLVRLLGAFAFLFYMEPKLAISVVVILPIFAILSRVYFNKMRKLNRSVRKLDSKAQSVIQEHVQHNLVVKTLLSTDRSVDMLRGVHRQLHKMIIERTKFSTFSFTTTNIGFAGAYLLAFLWGAYNLKYGIISYGTLIAFVQLVAQIQLPFRDLMKFIPNIVDTYTSIERVLELEAVPSEDVGVHVNISKPLGIRFTNVTYRYSDSQRNVLHNFNLTINPCTCNAVIGATGAGKTTLIRLVLALFKPIAGGVEIFNSHESVNVCVGTRPEIIYVPQGNTLLSGTIRENLLLGNPFATDDEIREALHCACAEFVYDLSEGLETMCGELGLGLSEGQSQRIVIARSLLRKGSILLLDEVTSALDIETEKQLIANLTGLTKHDKTLLFITHRTEVLALCDQIIDLES